MIAHKISPGQTISLSHSSTRVTLPEAAKQITGGRKSKFYNNNVFVVLPESLVSSEFSGPPRDVSGHNDRTRTLIWFVAVYVLDLLEFTFNHVWPVYPGQVVNRSVLGGSLLFQQRSGAPAPHLVIRSRFLKSFSKFQTNSQYYGNCTLSVSHAAACVVRPRSKTKQAKWNKIQTPLFTDSHQRVSNLDLLAHDHIHSLLLSLIHVAGTLKTDLVMGASPKLFSKIHFTKLADHVAVTMPFLLFATAWFVNIFAWFMIISARSIWINFRSSHLAAMFIQ